MDRPDGYEVTARCPIRRDRLMWCAPRREKEATRTEVAPRIARTVVILAQLHVVRAVRERRVPVADVVEEVDLVLASEERGAHTVHGRVAPALEVETGVSKWSSFACAENEGCAVASQWGSPARSGALRLIVINTHFVVESALRFQVIEELRVGFASPKL